MGHVDEKKGFYDLKEYGHEGSIEGLKHDDVEQLVIDLLDEMETDRLALIKIYIENLLFVEKNKNHEWHNTLKGISDADVYC